MGLFSSNKICAVCGKPCGIIKFALKDKLFCCADCFKAADFTSSTRIFEMTPDEVKKVISERDKQKEKISGFHTTKSVGNWLKIDESKREWFIPSNNLRKSEEPHIHSYDDVLDFELLEDGGSIVKGGVGRAIVGGILFGGAGAIVGGVTGKKKAKATCTSLKVKITLNDISSPAEYINLITSETKKSDKYYINCQKQAQEIISIFQVMCESNKLHEQNKYQNDLTISNTNWDEEILKLKSLLDAGAISKGEFEAMKKKLLGL